MQIEHRLPEAAGWIAKPCEIGCIATTQKELRACMIGGGRGAKARLSTKQQAQLVAWVESGPDPKKDGVVRWRCVDLQARVKEDLGVTLHERTIGKYLAKHGFRRLSVRPEHPKTDRTTQEAFKKNFATLIADTLPEKAKGKPSGNMVSG